MNSALNQIISQYSQSAADSQLETPWSIYSLQIRPKLVPHGLTDDWYADLYAPMNNPMYLYSDLATKLFEPAMIQFVKYINECDSTLQECQMLVFKRLKYWIPSTIPLEDNSVRHVAYSYHMYPVELELAHEIFLRDIVCDFPIDIIMNVPSLRNYFQVLLNTFQIHHHATPTGFNEELIEALQIHPFFADAWLSLFPVAQTLVEAVTLPFRSGAALLRIPIHAERAFEGAAKCVNSVASDVTTASHCGALASVSIMDAITAALNTTIKAYTDVITLSTTDIVTIVEVLLDVCGDISMGCVIPFTRWVTYISRVTRVIAATVPNVLPLFMEIFAANIAPLSQEDVAVSQGSATSLMTIIIALVGVGVMQRVPSQRDLKSFFEYAKSFNILFPTANNLAELFSSFGEILPNCVKVWFYSVTPEFFWIDQIEGGEHGQFIRDVLDFTSKYTPTNVMYNTSLHSTIDKLVDQGTKCALAIAALDAGQGKYFTLVRDAMKKLDAMKEQVDVMKKASVARLTPFCVCFTGESQVGKSMIATALTRYLFPDVPENCRSYVRKVSSKHWDGYFGQASVRYDDFAQSTEFLDVVELFDIVTCAPYIVPMASLDDKGAGKKGDAFTSELVVLCTNFPYPRPNVIGSFEALHKRRHLLIECLVKDDFKSHTGVKYQSDYSHLRFCIRDSVEPSKDLELNFDSIQDLFVFIKEKRIAHISTQEVLRDFNLNINDHIFEDAAQAQGLFEIASSIKTNSVLAYDKFVSAIRLAPEFARAAIIRKIIVAVGAISATLLAAHTLFSIGKKHVVQSEGAVPSGDFKTRRMNNRIKTVTEGMLIHPPVIDLLYTNQLDKLRSLGKLTLTEHGKTRSLPESVNPRTLTTLLLDGAKLNIVTPDERSRLLARRFLTRLCFKENISLDQVSIHDATPIPLTSSIINGIFAKGLEKLRNFGDLVFTSDNGDSTGVYFPVEDTTTEEDFEYYDREGYELRLIPFSETARVNAARYLERLVVKSEGSEDPNARMLAIDNIALRVGHFSVQFSDTHRSKMLALPIGGTFLLAPRHLFLDRSSSIVSVNTPLSFTVLGVEYRTLFRPECLHLIKNKDGSCKDAVVYEFGPSLRSFKTITNLFMNENDLDYVIRTPGNLITLSGSQPIIHNVSITPTTHLKYIQENNPDNIFRLLKGFQYSAQTQGGDCGAPLVQYNTRCPRKLLGLHVAGRPSASVGYAEYISFEDLDVFTTLLETRVKNFFEPTKTQGLCDDEPKIELPEGNFSYFGTVHSSCTVFQPTKSNIIPSPISGEISEPVTFPAKLGINEYVPNISRNAKQPDPFRYDFLQLIKTNLQETFSFPRLESRILSEFEAINGIPALQYFDRMNMHSSPGYPYCLGAKRGGKQPLFDFVGEDYYVSDVRLRNRLDERLRLAKLGERLHSVSVDFQKDERVVPGKKTRLFTIMPVDFTILVRQYMLSFVANFYSHHLSFYSAVGMDPFSIQYTQLINTLLTNAPNGFAGDYKGFDGICHAQVMDMVCDMINEWYSDEEDHAMCSLVRKVLFNEIIHTPILASNVLYGTHGGNPSGCPITTVLNTIVNAAYLRYAWLCLVPIEMKSLSVRDEMVKEFVYGDDHVVSVKQKAIEYYNFNTVAKFFNSIGITYTDANKNETSPDYEPITDLSFLKCVPRQDGMYYKPLLKERSIFECLNWITNSGDPVDLTVVNANEALRYAYFYGPEYFNVLRNKIKECFDRRAWREVLRDYMYFDNKFLGVEDTVYTQGSETPTETVHDDDLDKVGTTAHAPGVSFVEQTDVASKEANPMISIKDTGSATGFEWGLETTLNKPWRIKTGTFSTLSVFNDILENQAYPGAFKTRAGPFQNIFKSFVYWKGNVKVRIELNGTKFHQGMLLAYIIPMHNETAVFESLSVNTAAATSMQHAFLDASKNSVVEFDLPWFYYREYFDLRAEETDVLNPIPVWRLNLKVLNPLLTATGGSTSISYSIFLSAHNSKFKIPILAAAQGGVQSHNTYNMEGWSNVASATLPSNVSGDKFDIKGSVSTMDKPANTIIPMSMVRRPMSYLGHASNIENLNRLCLEPGGVSTAREDIAGQNEDCMSFDYLFSKFTYLETIPIAVTATTGTRIMTRPITPVQYPIDMNPSSFTRNNPLYLPLLSYIALPFDFWRGSIKVRFQFVCSAFHTAKFAFCVNYGMPAISTILSTDLTSQMTYYFELNSEKRCFDFEVPYVKDMEWCKIPILPYKTGATTSQQCAVNTLFSTGFMSLVLVNPIVVPSNVANSMEVNVYLAGGDNFEVNSLTRGCPWGVVAQGEEEECAETLTRLDGFRGTRSSNFTEKYTSVRQILKRYYLTRSQQCNSRNTVMMTGRTDMFAVTPMIYAANPGSETDNRLPQTPLQYFSAMFRADRGSIRIKSITTAFRASSSPDDSRPMLCWNNLEYVPHQCPYSFSGVLYRGLVPAVNNVEVVSNDAEILNGVIASTDTVKVGYNMSGAARDVAFELAPHNEVELPHLTQNTLRLSTAYGTDSASGTYYGTEMYAGPSSISARFIEANNHGTVINTMYSPNQAEDDIYVKYYTAIGDDFRFYGLLGPAPLYYSGITTLPGPVAVNHWPTAFVKQS